MRRKPIQLQMKVDVWPTRDNIVTTRESPRLEVEILDKDGRAAASIEVLVRDKVGSIERWYKTNADGEIVVELPDDPTIILVPFEGVFLERNITAELYEELLTHGKKLVIRLETPPGD